MSKSSGAMEQWLLEELLFFPVSQQILAALIVEVDVDELMTDSSSCATLMHKALPNFQRTKVQSAKILPRFVFVSKLLCVLLLEGRYHGVFTGGSPTFRTIDRLSIFGGLVHHQERSFQMIEPRWEMNIAEGAFMYVDV